MAGLPLFTIPIPTSFDFTKLAKPGSKSHGGYPKTSGSPKERHLHQRGETWVVDPESEKMHPPL
ncbi:hypothetical protein Ancab_019284 [Ancistrocladus abbreviatus]